MKSIAQTLYETCKDFEELKEGLTKHEEDLRGIEFGIETLDDWVGDGGLYHFHNGNDTYTFKDGSVLYTRHYRPHGYEESA